MKRHLQCAEQQKAASNFSKYCACHANESHDWSASHMKTSFTMRRATGITLQLHQILRLSHAKWISWLIHITYETSFTMRGSNKHQPPTSPNTAPATQNESHDWCTSHMKRHLQCAEQQSNTLQPHQILGRLPRKMNLMIDPHHIWNVIYNARSNRHHPPTSPNTAPATQNCTPKTYRNLLKTAEVPFPMRDRSDHDPTMIRPRSENDPTQKTQNWTRRAAKATFRTRQEQNSIENYNVSAGSGYHSKFHQMLHLPRKVTHELHQMLRLPQKVTHELHQMLHLPRKVTHVTSPNAAPATKSDTWTSPNAAPTTKSHTWTSPNAAPATKSDTWTSPNAAPATKSDTWTSPNAAPATKSDTWTSPNAAPATKSDTKWHMTTTTTTTTTTTRTTTTRTATTTTTTTRITTTRTTTTRTTTTRTTTTRTTDY